jgi:vitamin B12 transporter
MSLLLLLAAQTADPQIVVTASLLPVEQEEAPASVTVFDELEIEALGEPFALDYLRLSPGVSVASTGPQGTQTQVRIRGAEANHTLLFVDGIAFNDVASDNQARFESFTADGLSRIEVIRGPQSALWGSEALGGVVALSTPDPLGRRRASALAEYGSLGTARASGVFALGGETSGVAATASWARSDGIDILGGGGGDRDGFENGNASVKGIFRPATAMEVGAVGRYVAHASDYDSGFPRADSQDRSEGETYAVRAWARWGLAEDSPWSLKVEAQHLDGEGRNFVGRSRTNDSLGGRTRAGGQVVRRFVAAGARHSLVAAVEREDERFRTRVRNGGTDVDYERARTAFVGEWRAEWGDVAVTDLALRRDDFNRFRDATTIRGNLLVNLSRRLAAFAGYSEGLAQPGFADLFGFGPNTGHIPNAALRPERSAGFESGLRWRGQRLSGEIAGFSNDLEDEILFKTLSFSPFTYTYENGSLRSRRRGVEASAEWRPTEALSLGAGYTYLDARDDQDDDPATIALAEIRRPKHSASLMAAWAKGPLSIGASAAYVGKRRDTDFDIFRDVELGDYVLAGVRAAYRITANVELFGRIDNVGDADYQDVVGYATQGRTVHAGLRLRLGS